MASSTSPSSSWLPRRAAALLATAAIAWLLAAGYSVWRNPEVQYFRQLSEAKQRWLGVLAGNGEPKIIVSGGSGTGTSVDPERMSRRFGLRVANLGLAAAMGSNVIVRYALDALRAGDTLIVALEPELLARDSRPEPLGVQFSFAIQRPELLRDPDSVDWLGAAIALRPGGYHLFTLLGKVLTRHPLYRYRASDIRDSGWQPVTVARSIVSAPLKQLVISASARRLLQLVVVRQRALGGRVAYSFPMLHVAAEHLEQHRKNGKQLAVQLSALLPVLHDPDFGAYSDASLFADTPLHALPAGVELRSDALAQQIRSWRLWSRAELQAP